MLQAAVVMPIGLFVAIRFAPLWEASPETGQLAAALGGLTVLLAPVIALNQPDFQRVLSYLGAGSFGWMLLGLGTQAPNGRMSALFLLLIHMLSISSLWLVIGRLRGAGVPSRSLGGTTSESGDRQESAQRFLPMESPSVSRFSDLSESARNMPWARTTILCGSLVLCLGIWGQNSILEMLWQQAVGDGRADADRFSLILICAASLGLALTGLALFRGFFSMRAPSPVNCDAGQTHDNPASSTKTSGGLVQVAPRGALILLATALLLGLVFAVQPESCAGLLDPSWEPAEPAMAPVYVNFGTLLASLGIVAAWMIYSRPAEWPPVVEQALAPIVRLGQNRFYLDDVAFLMFLIPLRGMAQLVRFADWFLVDGLIAKLATRVPTLLSRGAGALRTANVQLYALSLLLATAVLFAVLSRLKG
jgi:NADH:ubiquinone oxidoreductase subunit 5 (subunit L)/multisubunit Na+/H+ antiporter MnhA subunit